jgi:hypothetical protein
MNILIRFSIFCEHYIAALMIRDYPSRFCRRLKTTLPMGVKIAALSVFFIES